jgi:hypothetical protein
VDVASPWYPLAMKLFAARAEIDADDIALLYRQLGFTTVDEGQACSCAIRGWRATACPEPASPGPRRDYT